MQSTNVYDIYKMETNEPHRLKYNLIDKLDLKNPNKNIALASLSIYYTRKNVKSIYNNNKFKFPHLHAMIHLIYLMDRIIYLLHKVISNI